MKKFGLICFAAIASLVATPAKAQEYLPAPELVEEALSSHPNVRAWTSRVAGAQGEARRLAAGPYEWMLNGSSLQRSVRGIADFGEFDIGVARGIRMPGKSEIDRRIGEYGIDAARNAAEDSRHQAALQLMSGWMEWLSAVERLSISQELIRNYETELDATRKRFVANDVAEIDVELLRTALAEARTTELRAEGETRRAQASLVAWFPELTLPSSPPAIEGPVDTKLLAALRDQVVLKSHEIAYVDAQARRAEAVAERARADQNPDPQIGLRAFSERDGEETGIGITFSIPIGGSSREASTSEQYALASAARQDAVRIRRTISEVAESDFILAKSEFEAWRSAQDALAESERVIQRMRAGFSQGAIRLQDLLTAERRHLDVRLVEADSRARASTALLKLRIDSHELWIAD